MIIAWTIVDKGVNLLRNTITKKVVPKVYHLHAHELFINKWHAFVACHGLGYYINSINITTYVIRSSSRTVVGDVEAWQGTARQLEGLCCGGVFAITLTHKLVKIKKSEWWIEIVYNFLKRKETPYIVILLREKSVENVTRHLDPVVICGSMADWYHATTDL
jgi:hypothetical protein